MSLSADLFAALSDEDHQNVVLVGLPQILAVPLSIAQAVIPSASTSSWKIMQKREDINEIVMNTEDIPHWYYQTGDERKENGARRRPSDPREYWCWERCLSEEKRISLEDTFNPDPATWLEDCKVVDCEVEDRELIMAEEEEERNTVGELDAIPESQDDEDDW